MFSRSFCSLRFAAVLLAACFLSLTSTPMPAQGPQDLGTVRPSPVYQKSTIAVVPFNIDSQASVEMESFPRIIRNDLTLSGYFKMPAKQIEANRLNLTDNAKGTIHFQQWAEMDVEHYLMGKVREENGQFAIKVLMYDIDSRRLIMNREFTDHKARLRYLAHKISDAVIEQLKGDEGICRTKLVYVTEQVPGVKEVALMDWDGFNARTMTDFGKLVTTPTWGYGGKELYFTSYHGNRANIYGLKLNADNAYNFNPGQMWTIAAYGGTNHSPAWSPASQRIAMVLSKDGNSELYSSDRQGNDVRRLTKTSHTEGSPTWSPDGSKIAFTSNDAGGIHLYLINADGSGRKRITRQGTWSDGVTWSPDGTRLAFAHRVDNRSDIYICDPDGNNFRRLTMNQGNNESPVWAPDSRHIAFSSDRSGTWQIYVMLDDGQNQRQITSTGRNILPDWGPIPGTQ